MQLIKPPHLVIGLSASTDSWKTAPTEQQLKTRFEAIGAARLRKVAIFGGNYDFIQLYRPLLQSFLMKSDDGDGLAAYSYYPGVPLPKWDGVFTVYERGWCGGDCTHHSPIGGKPAAVPSPGACRQLCLGDADCRAWGFQSGRCYSWPCFFTQCDFTNCDHTSVAGNRSQHQLPPPPPEPPAATPPPEPTLEGALGYVMSLVGKTRYGWWTGGPIPLGPPAWSRDGPPPDAAGVRATSCFCAGLPNLMLRAVHRAVPCERCPASMTPGAVHFCGGTGAYGRNFSAAARPFSQSTAYPRGTLLGVRYHSTREQGHVAIVLEPGPDGKILQSYSDCKVEPCPLTTPGVVANWTLRDAMAALPFCKFEYAVLPQHWLGVKTDDQSVIVRLRTLQTDAPRNPTQRSYWMLQRRPGAEPNATAPNGRCASGGGPGSTACSGFTATEVLKIIERLRPTQLERFISGQQDLDKSVPVDRGEAPMNVLQFLNAAQERLAPGGEITVRASLNEWCCGKPICPRGPGGCPGASGPIPNGGLAAFLNTTQNLWAVGQALKQPFRTIGLDNWSGPHKAGVKPELVRQMLQAVRAQGWEQIAVNEVGGFYDSFGLAATAEFGVVQDAESASVRPDHAALERIKSAGIENADLYIDFPGQYATFDTLSVDEQADALVALGRNQSTQGYRFVWAVAQGHCTPHCDHKPCPEPCDSCPFPYNGTHGSCKVLCDTTRAMTSRTGKYKGQSLFDVIAAEVQRERGM